MPALPMPKAVGDFTVTKLSFWKLSQTITASNFKIYYSVALERLYISSGNGVFICFWSAATRIKIFISDHIWVTFVDTVKSISNRFKV